MFHLTSIIYDTINKHVTDLKSMPVHAHNIVATWNGLVFHNGHDIYILEKMN